MKFGIDGSSFINWKSSNNMEQGEKLLVVQVMKLFPPPPLTRRFITVLIRACH
jgi:hypothetical protein